MALKIPLPSGNKRWIVLGGGGLLVSIPTLFAVLFVLGFGSETSRPAQFEGLLERLSGQDLNAVEDAITRLSGQKEILRQRNLLEKIVEGFSGNVLARDESRHAWLLTKEFWRIVLTSGAGDVEEFVAVALSRLRHRGVLIYSRQRLLASLEEMALFGASTTLKDSFMNRELLEDLLDDDRRPSMSWDRAQVAELADRVDIAYETLQGITYEKVIRHWEVNSLGQYMVYRADLLGRIRKKYHALYHDKIPKNIDFDFRREITDPEIRGFLGDQEGTIRERYENLFLGIFWFHRGEYSRAIRAFDGFLEDSGEESLELGFRSFGWRLAFLYRALARFEAASIAYRKVEPPTATKERASSNRERLERRLARYFAELRLRNEYDEVIKKYFLQTRRDRPLFDALGDVV